MSAIKLIFHSRKVEVYDMEWIGDINIDNVVIVAARFGGPIAVIRDRTKPGKIATKSMGKPVIGIYSAAGNLISSFVVIICFGLSTI